MSSPNHDWALVRLVGFGKSFIADNIVSDGAIPFSVDLSLAEFCGVPVKLL